ncbi:MAG: galactokinase [Candidatus Aminicenantes bacterium RBG_16_63_16]|nr:MAG: galactokinase [Candidatus Aminicenantes bacterium RBG_16_63_16]
MENSHEKLFVQLYGTRPAVLASAPGRINLIGEHTDYNNGYVLPAAIQLRNYFLAAPGKNRQVRVRTENFDESEAFDLDSLKPSEQKHWADYVKGIFWALEQDGHRLGGVDALIWGEVPLEAGLSSSAALEVSIIKGLTHLFGIDLRPERLAKLAQKAENDFVGMRCGLMDQFIAVFGRRDSALFLDCETLAYEHFPINLNKNNLGILVYDTKVRRRLAGSEYNTRREEASRALEILKAHGAATYKEATLVRLEETKPAMSDVLYRRAKHVISENARVRLSVKALKTGNYFGLGALLFQSHESLRDDYEVSCPELDLLYETGRRFLGCLGARLVGAGFGGSGIAIVEKSRLDAFEEMLRAAAKDRGFPEPGFREVSVGEGALAVRLSNQRDR